LTPIRRRRHRHAKTGDAGTAVEEPGVVIVAEVAGATDAAEVTDAAEIENVPLEEIVADSEDADSEQAEPSAIVETTSTLVPTTVIVVGAGSPEGVALVQALSKSGHRVVAVDHDLLAPGLRLARLGAVIPPTDDPLFKMALRSVVRSSEARVVLAPLAEDMSRLAEAQELLAQEGTSTWVPSRNVFELCRDLGALDHVLTSSGLPEDKTGLGLASDVPENRRNFSVDVLVDRDHDLLTAVSSWRVTARAGTTTVAETFFDTRLLELVRAVCAAMLIEGPAVVEGYEADYRIRLTGIRPGFSDVSPLTRAAGVDIVSLTLAGALGHRLPPPLLTHRSGVRMLQYLDQVFEG
jgi:NAD(P)-dependent dehydrogenase (short-subunit alcohol dehydrogenase family)